MLTPQEKQKIREEFINIVENSAFESKGSRLGDIVDYFLDIIDKKIEEERKRIENIFYLSVTHLSEGARDTVLATFKELLQIINNNK